MTAEANQDLLGCLGIPETDQDVQQHGPRPRQEQVWCIQALGQPLGGPECSQRIGVPAAPQLEPPAEVLHRQPRRGLRILCDSSLGALNPGLRLLRPALPNQHGSEGQVRDAGGRVFGPAVPPSQFDGLHAALGCPCGRAVDLNSCLVRQSGEL